MKKLVITTLAAVALSFASINSARAEDTTIKGVASCAKGHETVIKVKEGTETVVYHLSKSGEGKGFHEKVCRESAQVKVTGEVKEANGKKILMAKKIELVKE